MFFLQVIAEKTTRQFKLMFSQELITSDETIKAFAIEAPFMHKFAEKFAAVLQICADFDNSFVQVIQECPLSIILPIDLPDDQDPNLEIFREFWIQYVNRTLFELTRDPKYKQVDSEATAKLFEAKIYKCDILKSLNSLRYPNSEDNQSDQGIYEAKAFHFDPAESE